MPYFLSEQNLGLDNIAEIAGPEARHILLAHRTKKGEQVKVQGPNGQRFLCEIINVTKTSLSIKPVQSLTSPSEPSVRIILFQAYVSEKALDFIFQKGTELGLSKIVLFNSSNTATKLSVDGFERKQERWNKILVEAAKQSERAKWPSLEFVGDVDQAVKKLKDLDMVYLTDIIGNKISSLNPTPSTLGLIVGPEGGFTQKEIGDFKSLANVQAISLGPILLRAETAALAAVAIIENLIN